MVLAVLRGEGARENLRYVGGRTKWRLAEPTMQPEMEGETAFESLKGEVEQKELPKAVRDPWISKETWRLENWRAALIRTGRASTREVHKAQHDFQRKLQEDRRRRVQAAGYTIEGLMAAGRIKETWDQLTRWPVTRRGGRSNPPGRAWIESRRSGLNSTYDGHRKDSRSLY